MRSLAVDHDSETRSLMVDILHHLAFDVVQAEDAEQAKVMMNTYPDIALILLDFNLPTQSGYDYLVELRLTPQYIEEPKVVVTCETSMGSMLSALAAGANEYIMKPFNEDVVVEKLDILGIAHAEVSDGGKTCH